MQNSRVSRLELVIEFGVRKNRIFIVLPVI